MIDGSGSIFLTRGSGSGSMRPKNIWIRSIRIRIPIRNTSTVHITGNFFRSWIEIQTNNYFITRCQACWPLRYRTKHLYSLPTLAHSKRTVPPCDFLAAFTTSPIQEFVLFVWDPSGTLTCKPLIRSHGSILFQAIKKRISILAGLEPAIFWFVIRLVVHCATGPSWGDERSLLLIYLVPLQAIKNEYRSWQDSNLQSSDS